eukprot:TRINITY_DN99_c1_g1_i9.p1 TRINITY_DN99_c1_g1~~TRINITY_DN99_c1_g1_i9.p1  ORF type:complete len:106 (+),score=2.92 TRINITY_DN99_c1_g1_i9:247-564(+)
MGRLENLEDNFEKKVVGLEPGLRTEVSCEDTGTRGTPPKLCLPETRGRVCPEWKVERSGTLRLKDKGVRPPPLPLVGLIGALPLEDKKIRRCFNEVIRCRAIHAF